MYFNTFNLFLFIQIYKLLFSFLIKINNDKTVISGFTGHKMKIISGLS